MALDVIRAHFPERKRTIASIEKRNRIKSLAFFFVMVYNNATALDGELAALCNLQSATAGSNTVLGLRMGGLLPLGGDDVKVLCNVCL